MCLWAKSWPFIKEFLIVFGPLLAAIIVIVGKEWFDRRRYCTSWFIEHFIIKGIDPLLAYLDSALLHAYDSRDKLNTNKLLFPSGALSAMRSFLNTDRLYSCFNCIECDFEIPFNSKIKVKPSDHEGILKWSGEVNDIRTDLLDLRDFMIKSSFSSFQKVYDAHTKAPYNSWIIQFNDKFISKQAKTDAK